MLKRLVSWKYGIAVVLILGCSIYVSRQDQKTRDEYETKCNQIKAVTVSQGTHQEDCDKGAEDAARHLPRWYRVFGWPEGITTWAILLTLLVIADQTAQTKRAAIATEDAAKAAMDSVEVIKRKEKARVKVRIGKLEVVKVETTNDSYFAVVKVELFNFGETKAFIANSCGDFSITRSDKPHATKFPEPLTSEPVIHATENPLEKKFPFFCDTGHDIIRSLNTGELFAHLYGMVSYTDVFEAPRVIRFRYLWTPNMHGVQLRKLISKDALSHSLYGEWKQHGDEQDNYDSNPN